jgi:hypothetical protein
MLYATDYFWIVICNNHRFHHNGAKHRTRTESQSASLRWCVEHWYESTEILRNEIEIPESSVPHRLFR